ncbi:hypothetical protein I5523_18780 [Acinetobacter oleivorans]|uniref:hypothetical protein n=1 Tax=Acinetobacter oleivorans TaxID=1148157 RepID=UPI0019024374|nr:hypothetical protein [Acinetobacter oleivorans]MBJ9741678.1 hypothetical protein [Acinetobacter oleivorans]
MFIISNCTRTLFYFIVFYGYFFIKNRQGFHCKTTLISKLMKRVDSKHGIGTAIAKA